MNIPTKEDLLDLWSQLPDQLDKVRTYAGPVAETINANVDTLSTTFRETLASQTWLPDTIRPSPLPSPPPPVPVIVIPASLHCRVYAWVMRHKVFCTLLVAGAGTLAYRRYRQVKLGRRVRRARRAGTGARMEVVVIAGSPALPLTRSLALDLELKGYIVYVVCGALEEESVLRDMARSDIRPLSLDILEPVSSGAAIERFAQYLQTPHQPTPRTKPNNLVLKSIILIPSLNCQSSPIATIPPSSFGDVFGNHLLQPILTVQAFLPLLTARLLPGEDKWDPAKVLVFTPSIVSSINPPFHAPEATVCSALAAFTEVLAGELRPLGIPVTHMQLGTFDFANFMPQGGAGNAFRPRPRLLKADGSRGDESDPTKWTDGAKHAYGLNFIGQNESIVSSTGIKGLRGASLRHLHNSTFDVIDGTLTGRRVRVGLGASVYGFLGRWAPRPLLSYVMGIREVEKPAPWKAPARAPAPRPMSSDGPESQPLMDASIHSHTSNEFVAIPHDSGLDSGVWRH